MGFGRFCGVEGGGGFFSVFGVVVFFWFGGLIWGCGGWGGVGDVFGKEFVFRCRDVFIFLLEYLFLLNFLIWGVK